MKKRKLTPPELAEMWSVTRVTVVRWIRSGELRAVDISTRRGGRPRYKIDIKDAEDFERRRTVKA